MAAVSPPSSLSPPEVPMKLHAINREKLVKSLQQHLAESGRPIQGLVLLQGGEEKTRYCTDHAELFRQESYFAYLFGVKEPGFYGAVDVATGKSILFAPRLPAEYAVWLGKIKPLPYFKEKYMVSMTSYVDEIEPVLCNEYKGQDKPLLFMLHGLNTDSGNFSKPAEFKGLESFQNDLSTLHPILTECRVTKSKEELALIQYANDLSSEAHIEVMRNAKVGMKEYQLESMFLHHTYMYGGCRHCSYTCICATGENSSVLHYGHAAAPNEKTLENGGMALLDMGAEYHFYGSDITCSFPVNGKFTDDQRLIYNCALNLDSTKKLQAYAPLVLPPPPLNLLCRHLCHRRHCRVEQGSSPFFCSSITHASLGILSERNDVLKKAYELSVHCDARVALFIFLILRKAQYF